MADDLTVAIYRESMHFPREEIYGLTSQLRRAAYSVAANIAEGAGRQSKKDYLHFLYIARGSVSETQYFVHLSQRLGYLDDRRSESVANDARKTFACLSGLIRAVEKEAGAIPKIAAVVTSCIALAAAKLVTTKYNS